MSRLPTSQAGTSRDRAISQFMSSWRFSMRLATQVRLGWSIDRVPRPKKRSPGCLGQTAVAARTTLHPERLAYLEAGGWRAYYDRNWPKLIGLMVQLNQEQFHIPFPLSVVAAFHVARGSVAWAPVEHDEEEVRQHFTRFYRMAKRWSGMPFQPRRAPELEVDYWIEHRRLVSLPAKESFIQAI